MDHDENEMAEGNTGILKLLFKIVANRYQFSITRVSMISFDEHYGNYLLSI